MWPRACTEREIRALSALQIAWCAVRFARVKKWRNEESRSPRWELARDSTRRDRRNTAISTTEKNVWRRDSNSRKVSFSSEFSNQSSLGKSNDTSSKVFSLSKIILWLDSSWKYWRRARYRNRFSKQRSPLETSGSFEVPGTYSAKCRCFNWNYYER